MLSLEILKCDRFNFRLSARWSPGLFFLGTFASDAMRVGWFIASCIGSSWWEGSLMFLFVDGLAVILVRCESSNCGDVSLIASGISSVFLISMGARAGIDSLGLLPRLLVGRSSQVGRLFSQFWICWRSDAEVLKFDGSLGWRTPGLFLLVD